MKIVLITRDRPELTRQTIETMQANATDWNKHRLVVVFDGTHQETAQYDPWPWICHQAAGLSLGKQFGVGGAKNHGVDFLKELQPEDILMFSDNDMYYLPNWDQKLELGLHTKRLGVEDIVQLGGWKHPFHGSKWHTAWSLPGYKDPFTTNEVDAVTGNCFVIRYSDWLKYGPFDSNALGPGQSEDFALSQKIIKDGGVVATLDPPVAIHCGLANCEGNPATGWQEMAKMAEQQLDKNSIDKIWMAVPDEGTVLIERIKNNNTGIVEHFAGLNVGSGQRRFDSTCGWINVDYISRPPEQVPDVVLDASTLEEKFPENSQDMVVLHHVLEHFGCGEADDIIRQCYKVLKPGGSLLIFVPDLRKLAGRWLSGELETFLFMVNAYGAYQGEEGDRHKWGYDLDSIQDYLSRIIPFAKYWYIFDWRDIPGADIAKDWWILGVEVVK